MTMTHAEARSSSFRDINKPAFMIAAAVIVMLAPNGFNFLPFMLGAAAEVYSLTPSQIETITLAELVGTSAASIPAASAMRRTVPRPSRSMSA